MNATYRTRIDLGMLGAISFGSMASAGLHFVRRREDKVQATDAGRGWTIVEFLDDDAPEELDGCLVSPVFRREEDGTVTIVDRSLDNYIEQP